MNVKKYSQGICNESGDRASGDCAEWGLTHACLRSGELQAPSPVSGDFDIITAAPPHSAPALGFRHQKKEDFEKDHVDVMSWGG